MLNTFHLNICWRIIT